MGCNNAWIERVCENPDKPQSAEVKELSQECGVRYSGLVDVPLLRRLGRVRTTCTRLVHMKPEVMLEVSVDKRLDRMLRPTTKTKYKTLEYSEYRGFAENAFFGLLFLLKRVSLQCVIMPGLQAKVDQLLTQPDLQLEDIDWGDVSIVWDARTSTLTFPGGEEVYRETVQNCDLRFSLTMVTLISSDGEVYHANILMYDHVQHELERFEPYAATNAAFHGRKLDRQLRRMYESLSSDQNLRVINPPRKPGLQELQEMELLDDPNDPVGFCQVWSLLYACVRVAQPFQLPETIVGLIQMFITEHHTSRTQFIRAYSMYLWDFFFALQLQYEEKYAEHSDHRVVMYGLMLEEIHHYAAHFGVPLER